MKLGNIGGIGRGERGKGEVEEVSWRIICLRNKEARNDVVDRKQSK